jgi:hypothetical protein
MAQEKNFEEKVKKFLKDEGCWFIKYWGGGGFTKSGVPDLLVCLNGYFMAIELKAPKGKPSELQLYNLKKITKGNGIAILLYPKDFDQFKEFCERILMGEIPSNLYDSYPFLTEWWDKYIISGKGD